MLRKQLFDLVLWGSNKFASRPQKDRVFGALDEILQGIRNGKEKKGIVIPFHADSDRFIIFSDQHKGARNGADDFMICEPNYLAALDFYAQHNFQFITLGDSEELWENSLQNVLRNQQPSFARYKTFLAQNRFHKVVGNHDLDWKYDPLTVAQIKNIFGADVPVYDGILLQTTINNKELVILCTHGHQGDKASDGSWFSKFFVSKIWAPLQAWLKINPNTPAYDSQLKNLHNNLMYEWSVGQEKLLVITGHTHQPVFGSLTYIERLYRQLLVAKAAGNTQVTSDTENEIRKRKLAFTNISEDYLRLKPTYFNTGCCCYNDGDITGIELCDGSLRLVKWTGQTQPVRQVLEEETLDALLAAI